MQAAWAANMAAVQAAIVNYGGFDWQNFETVRTPTSAQCSSFLRSQCADNSTAQTSALQYDISYQYNKDHSGGHLIDFAMDLAVFLATRGPFSWLGYGWMGCGCGWEYDGKMPCDIYQRPAELDLDYGTPTGLCKETSSGSGVFVRDWTKATVTVDCNAYNSTVQFKREG
mmetsp:Transcript_33199/g.77854  ORF Transcript_33199/g.77854 Transcript_33199/m.77854 type:complete len:170 (-) Transcript_33199:26-535(-)